MFFNKNSIKEQIASKIRRQINTGELKPHDQIASTEMIAKEFGTMPSNVHRALLPLVREGLIIRKAGYGSIVNPDLKRLRQVAVCFSYEQSSGGSLYRQMVANMVCDELEKRGLAAYPLHYTGAERLIRQLNTLAASGEVQGAILSVRAEDLQDVQDKLTLPYAVMASSRVRFGVMEDTSEALDNAMRDLKERGVKNVALVGTIIPAEVRKRIFRERPASFIPYDSVFRRSAAKHGIQTPENLIAMAESLPQAPHARVQFAYETVRRILSGNDRPDALFIRTDDLLPGAIYALKETGIRIPHDMRLVFGSNRELSVFCPFPCFKLELSLAEIVSALVDTLESACHGQKVACRKIKRKYVEEIEK